MVVVISLAGYIFTRLWLVKIRCLIVKYPAISNSSSCDKYCVCICQYAYVKIIAWAFLTVSIHSESILKSCTVEKKKAIETEETDKTRNKNKGEK